MFGHTEKAHQHRRVGKEDCVVKERLRQHQHEPEQRPLPMFVRDRIPNLPPRRMRACAYPSWSNGGLAYWSNGNVAQGYLWDSTPILHYSITPSQSDTPLHLRHDPFRFLISPMNHQPARTLRNPPAKENNDQSKNRADRKGKPPA